MTEAAAPLDHGRARSIADTPEDRRRSGRAPRAVGQLVPAFGLGIGQFRDLPPHGAILRGNKSRSELDFLLDDIAVLLSRDLQHGDRLAQIASGLRRLPDGKPASLIGAVVDRLCSIESDEP